MKKMKMKNIIIGIIIVVILGIIGTTSVVSGGGVFNKYNQQIKLGYKYLNDGKYEEAIIAFNKAIEIEAKKDKAYVGLADTYISRCDENVVEDTNSALKKGYEETESENIVNAYIENADKLHKTDKTDLAIELLQKGYEVTKNEELLSKKEEIIKELSLKFLEELYSLFEKGDIEKAKKIMRKDEFKNSIWNYEDPIIYIPDDKNGNIGIGRYAQYIYYGEYEEGIRSGKGKWLYVLDDDKFQYVFDGTWKNDKPNGIGELRVSPLNYGGKQAYEIFIGNLIDGLWQGEVKNINLCDSFTGIVEEEFIIRYKNGKFIPIKEVTHDNGQKSYIAAIGKKNNTVYYFSYNPILGFHGIYGFIEKIIK